MTTQKEKPIDTDEDRQHLLNELTAEHGPDWREDYKPGSFGCHELLDRTALAVDSVERTILAHPACVQDPEWYRLAEQAVAALNELYQRIGAEHLDAEDAPTS